MSETIETGAEFRRSFTVDAARTIDFMGPELRVYATPAIVHDLETACRDWLLARLEPNRDSVGVLVEIEHKRATPLGAGATHEVKVTGRDGRRVSFEIVVRDAVEEVARARHQRMIVDKDRLAEAISAKRAKLAG